MGSSCLFCHLTFKLQAMRSGYAPAKTRHLNFRKLRCKDLKSGIFLLLPVSWNTSSDFLVYHHFHGVQSSRPTDTIYIGFSSVGIIAICSFDVRPLQLDILIRSKSAWNPVCRSGFRDECQGYMRSLFPLPTEAGAAAGRKEEIQPQNTFQVRKKYFVRLPEPIN